MSTNPKKIKGKFHIRSKYVFFILAAICCGLIILTWVTPGAVKPFKAVATVIFVPVQKGMNHVGLWFSDKADTLRELRDVMSENEELTKKLDELTLENTALLQQQSELDRLRELYELDNTYSYDKIAARVIAKDPGNWFSVFQIDKGSKDGIAVDMNVIGGGGLVGIVIDVGPTNAKVRAIIDDESNVYSKFSSTSDGCIVQGNLKLMDQGLIQVTNIKKDAEVKKGDMIVTSHVSDKFLPDLLIGYVGEIEDDANNLTKSGTITPVVDFANLEEVLVITQLKDTGE